MPRSRYRSVRICRLPVDKINWTIGTELVPGDAWLSRLAHQHFAEDHPDDYASFFSILPETVENPTWIGQAAAHSENFELVTRLVAASGIVLTSVGLTPNKFGNYNVRSVYQIDQKDVDSRRMARRLWPTIQKPPRKGGF
jgi:hypothetical protein